MTEANAMWRIPLADVDLGAAEEAAVLAVLRRRWLSMGEVTAAFEADFAALTGARHALAVTNCTAALHLAGLALGWGPGDEVIVPSLTFVATANAVRYTGATPVFADITSLDDFSLSAGDAAARITPRTRAITVVHYGGHAADMGAILALAEQHGLDVVEDVAHAPGATLDGQALGTWGRIGCFSFFANKNMTTGEGGMLTTDDDELAARLRLLRSHGMTSLTWDRHRGHAWSYDVVAPGYNYRLDELRAAIGRVQLAKLPAANERRRALDDLYRRLLPAAAPALGVPYGRPRGEAAYHLRPVLLPAGVDRARFMGEMKTHGIQTSIHYPPVHRFSYYREQGEAALLPLTDEIGGRVVTLPLFPGLTPADVESVVAAVAEALAAAGGEVARPLVESSAAYD
jgi:dTDP-4-amino-4,6-dideoxygalactose transaminase